MEVGYWNVLHHGFLVVVRKMRDLLLMVDARQRLALRYLSWRYYGLPLLSIDGKRSFEERNNNAHVKVKI